MSVHSTAPARLRSLGRRYWRYVRRAPGTHLWIAFLLVTSEVIRDISPATARRILELHSTNLHYLGQEPVRVLLTSTWYLAGSWPLYFVLFNLFHVPVERWLGTRRWLAVLAITHAGATYLSQGVLYHLIHLGLAPTSAEHILDYGVSYALAGVQGVLTYLISRPWRYIYLATLLLGYGLVLAVERDFTSIGHFDALLLGLACYPLTRSRVGTVDPVRSLQKLKRALAHCICPRIGVAARKSQERADPHAHIDSAE